MTYIPTVASAIVIGAATILYFTQNRQTASGQAVETSQTNQRAPSDDSTSTTTPDLSRSSVKSVHTALAEFDDHYEKAISGMQDMDTDPTTLTTDRSEIKAIDTRLVDLIEECDKINEKHKKQESKVVYRSSYDDIIKNAKTLRSKLHKADAEEGGDLDKTIKPFNQALQKDLYMNYDECRHQDYLAELKANDKEDKNEVFGVPPIFYDYRDKERVTNILRQYGGFIQTFHGNHDLYVSLDELATDFALSNTKLPFHAINIAIQNIKDAMDSAKNKLELTPDAYQARVTAIQNEVAKSRSQILMIFPHEYDHPLNKPSKRRNYHIRFDHGKIRFPCIGASKQPAALQRLLGIAKHGPDVQNSFEKLDKLQKAFEGRFTLRTMTGQSMGATSLNEPIEDKINQIKEAIKNNPAQKNALDKKISVYLNESISRTARGTALDNLLKIAKERTIEEKLKRLQDTFTHRKFAFSSLSELDIGRKIDSINAAISNPKNTKNHDALVNKIDQYLDDSDKWHGRTARGEALNALLNIAEHGTENPLPVDDASIASTTTEHGTEQPELVDNAFTASTDGPNFVLIDAESPYARELEALFQKIDHIRESYDRSDNSTDSISKELIGVELAYHGVKYALNDESNNLVETDVKSKLTELRSQLEDLGDILKGGSVDAVKLNKIDEMQKSLYDAADDFKPSALGRDM